MTFRSSLAFSVVFTAGILLSAFQPASAHPLADDRQITGVVATDKNQTLQNMLVLIKGATFERETQTGENGQFSVAVPNEDVTLQVEGTYVIPNQRTIRVGDSGSDRAVLH